MNYEVLNKIIDYIEYHIEEKIDTKNLAKIAGMNDFIFQRVFTFISGMTVNDYIKRRRLSHAYEDIKNTSDKIIDVATRYGYNSVASFNRAFKNLFQVTPNACRKSKTNYRTFPILYFDNNFINRYEIDYEIKTIKELTVYCRYVESDDYENLLYKIRKLYDALKKSGEHREFGEAGMYAMYKEKDDKYYYYVGSKLKKDGLKECKLKSGRYAIFKVNSRKQRDICDMESRIYKQWYMSTNYTLGPNENFEYYEGDHCYLYISID